MQLKKVKERPRPEIQKIDDRDSLLQQIRTKVLVMESYPHSSPFAISCCLYQVYPQNYDD